MILFRTTDIHGGIEKKTPWEQSSRGKKDWGGMVQRSDSEPQADNPVKYTDPDGRKFLQPVGGEETGIT